MKRSRINRFQLKMFDHLVWLWRRVDRFIPWKPTSLIVIANKPQVQGRPLFEVRLLAPKISLPIMPAVLPPAR
jgi:hypothetical protein